MTAERGQPVFIDTSAFYALVDEDDTWHPSAVNVEARLKAARSPQSSSNFVIAETHALFLSRVGRWADARFLERVDASRLAIIRVTADDEARAKAILRQYDDQDFSYTDATSFAVVERLQVPQIFTFDRDFERFGLAARVLRPA